MKNTHAACIGKTLCYLCVCARMCLWFWERVKALEEFCVWNKRENCVSVVCLCLFFLCVRMFFSFSLP